MWVVNAIGVSVTVCAFVWYFLSQLNKRIDDKHNSHTELMKSYVDATIKLIDTTYDATNRRCEDLRAEFYKHVNGKGDKG